MISPPASSSAAPAAQRAKQFFWLACAAGLALRLVYLSLNPRCTADVYRHLYYGWLVWREGLSIADQPLAFLEYVIPMHIWTNIPYSYPVMGLYFFTLLAGIWPSVFMAKAALTAIEGVNAWLLWKTTGSRWIALAYWLSPLSIWWVSREGQYEPLQNLFALLAIYSFMRRRIPVAFAMLALAIQVKLTAAALAPWMLGELLYENRRALLPALISLLLGFLPTFLACISYPALTQPFRYTNTLLYNPYGWVVLSQDTIGPFPEWLAVINAVASFTTLGVIFYAIAKTREPLRYAPALIFILFAKTSFKFLNWYWLVWPTMLAPIPDAKFRRWLWILYPFIDVGATLRILGIGMGNFLPADQFYPHSVFEAIRLFRM